MDIPRHDLSWRQQAACRGVDPDVFYPSYEDELARAKAICDGCPVREMCLEYALANHEREGVWGGLSDRERRRLQRGRRRTA